MWEGERWNRKAEKDRDILGEACWTKEKKGKKIEKKYLRIRRGERETEILLEGNGGREKWGSKLQWAYIVYIMHTTLHTLER